MQKFDVIGLSGKSGTGKDYIIQQCLRPEGYFQISFAWHFKIWLVSTGQATYEEVFHTKPEHIRRLMQLEGTERGRDIHGSNIWVDTAFAWMQLWNETWGVSKFVIGDVRFPNEADRILELGGKVMRIEAPTRVKNSKLTIAQKFHISETALDDYDNFSGYLFNDYDSNGKPVSVLDLKKMLNSIRDNHDVEYQIHDEKNQTNSEFKPSLNDDDLFIQSLYDNISKEVDAEMDLKKLKLWEELDRQYWKLLKENDDIKEGR